MFNDLFVADGRSFWSRQKEICKAVVEYRSTAVYSGNMIGKDFVCSRLIWWWLYTRPDSSVIVAGPSQTSIGTILWKEVRRSIPQGVPTRARLSKGAKTSPQMVDVGPGWQALGFSTNSIERASGHHNEHLLVIVDEASGVEDEVWDALDSLGYERLIAIGNPIRAEGRFIDLIHQAERDAKDGIAPRLAVKAIQIPSTDSPHATWEKSPWGLADGTWIGATQRKFGPDSFYCNCHIKALIPEVSSERLFPDSWLDYATSVQRSPNPPNHPVRRTTRIAVDLSEGVGRDSTAILVRDAHGILELVASPGLSLASAADEVARLARVYAVPAERISYDRLGVGRDFGRDLVRVGLPGAIGYAGNGRPRDKTRFADLRTEAAWKAHDRLNPDFYADPAAVNSGRQIPFAIPPRGWWALLREDLEAMTYECVGRLVRLIAKKDLLAQLGRSPDHGDAFIQSFAFD